MVLAVPVHHPVLSVGADLQFECGDIIGLLSLLGNGSLCGDARQNLQELEVNLEENGLFNHISLIEDVFFLIRKQNRLEKRRDLRIYVDNRDRCAVSNCHTDSRRWTQTVACCWESLGDAYVCVSLRIVVCVRGGKLKAKINGTVFRCNPEKHRHQSLASSPLSSNVCARTCASKYASVRVEPCASETGKIESAAALPYHQFTGLHFLYVCMSSLYSRRCRLG